MTEKITAIEVATIVADTQHLLREIIMVEAPFYIFFAEYLTMSAIFIRWLRIGAWAIQYTIFRKSLSLRANVFEQMKEGFIRLKKYT